MYEIYTCKHYRVFEDITIYRILKLVGSIHIRFIDV